LAYERAALAGIYDARMHILYLDESGSTGANLDDDEQPVFAMAGLIVSDEKWRLTGSAIQTVVTAAFAGQVPENFELHASELLSPEGEGPFADWDREKRLAFARALLELVSSRSHQVLLQVYDKAKLASVARPQSNQVFEWSDPWELAFSMVLTCFEEFLRGSSTGRTSSGMVIIDHQDTYLDYVRAHCGDRHSARGWRNVKKVVEIGYSAVSHANPMIQLTDLIAFISRKCAEAEAGYRDEWTNDAKDFYRECRALIWPRVQYKALALPRLGVSAHATDYVKSVRVF
jgi:hypothetical protein